jgi:hypothetical protein
MRTQSGITLQLALAALSLVATSGCDDVATGRPGETPGGPKVVRVLVQDSTFAGGPPAERAAATDLLDTAAPPTCSDINPCVNQFLIAQNTPPLNCSSPTGGTCIDPLAVPQTGVPLNAGANSIRVVFNKLLSSDVETVTTDPNGAPVAKGAYTIKPGLVELLGPDGKPVTTTMFWDSTGVSDYTSDLILVPFGPAIVITPSLLAPKATYTVRVHSSLLHDKHGNGITDAKGVALPDPSDYKFTTEDITPNGGLTYPTFSTKASVKILPNEALSLAYWEPLDEKTVMLTATGPAGFDPTAVEAYADRGAKASACAKALNPAIIDFVYTTGTNTARMPTDWPAGDYTFSFSAKDASGTVALQSPTYSFTVAGTDGDPKKDANSFNQHVTPEQCQ